jgi:hypothetical protein
MNGFFTGLSSVRTAYIDPSISAITSGAQYARGALSGAVTYSRSMISQIPTASEGYTLALSTLNSMGTTVGASLNAMKTTVINSGSSFVKSSMASANQGMAHASAFGSKQMTNLSTALNPTYQFAVSKFSVMAKTAAPYLDAVKTRAMDPAVAFGSRQIQKLPTTTEAREAVVSTITAMGDRSTTIGKTTVLVRNVVAVSVIVSAVAYGIWKFSTYIRDLKAQAARAERRATEAERACGAAERRAREAETDLRSAVADRAAAEAALELNQGALTAGQAAQADLTGRVRDLSIELSSLQIHVSEAQAARDAVTAQLAASQANRQVLIAIAVDAALRKQATQFDGILAKLDVDFIERTREFEAAIAFADETAGAASSEARLAFQSIAHFEQSAAAVTALLAERDREITDLRGQVESAIMEHRVACADHDAAAVRYAQLLRVKGEEMQEADILILALQENIRLAQAEVAALKEKLSSARAIIAAADRAVLHMTEIGVETEAEAEVESLRGQVKALIAARDESQAALMAFDVELRGAKAEVTVAKARSAEAEDRANTAESRVLALIEKAQARIVEGARRKSYTHRIAGHELDARGYGAYYAFEELKSVLSSAKKAEAEVPSEVRNTTGDPAAE